MGNMIRRRMDIRDVGTLLQFGLMVIAPPTLALCVFWVIRRIDRERK